jgi:hypothetical protein
MRPVSALEPSHVRLAPRAGCAYDRSPAAEPLSSGGWKDHNTILKAYQHPDMDAMREGLNRRLQLAV